MLLVRSVLVSTDVHQDLYDMGAGNRGTTASVLLFPRRRSGLMTVLPPYGHLRTLPPEHHEGEGAASILLGQPNAARLARAR